MHGKRTAAGMPGAAEAAAVFPPTASKPVLHRVDARDDRRGQYAWGMFEFARTPYIGLIFVFVFAPYFANTVVGDPVRGQEIWGLANTIAGVCIGLTAPLLGAIADRMGQRKPWLIAIVVVMTIGCFALWFAMPGAKGGLSVTHIAIIAAVLTISFEYSQVFHNAMLSAIAHRRDIGWLSGYGVAAGNIGNFLAMSAVLFCAALPASGAVDIPFLPDAPLFGLDPLTYQHSRIAGPVSGLWVALFTAPLLLWTYDVPATGIRTRQAVKEGMEQLWATMKQARKLSNIGRYLVARMLYNDGQVAILAYSGIIAAGVFKWDLTALILFSILLSPFSIAGGFIGGWLDKAIGSKRAILFSVLLSCFFMIGAASMTPRHVYFIFNVESAPPLWSFPYFRTLPEALFILNYMALAVTVTVVFCASRTMMVKLSPPQMMSQFFGLYALSGTATAFLGHGLVTAVTAVSHNQQAGFSSIILLLLAGAALLARVREESPNMIVSSER
ncbi:MFS transporter [Hyphococcus sp.]|uniref:MFS transporter n=1 Tax=Hyphococcus sp. TaxID=2038636 RepID=UPI0035C6A751